MRKIPPVYRLVRDYLDTRRIPHYILQDELTGLWSIQVVDGISYPKNQVDEIMKLGRCSIAIKTLKLMTDLEDIGNFTYRIHEV